MSSYPSVASAIGGQLLVARYNPNGSLDTSFSGNGLKGTNIPNSCEEALSSIGIDSKGRIVAGGYQRVNCVSGPEHTFLVARYNPDGSLDNSFSGNGLKGTNIPNAVIDQISSITADSQDRIVAGGSAIFPDGKRLVLARYNIDGSLDTSFGGTGIVITNILFSTEEVIGSIAIDKANGKIVAGGTYKPNPNDIRFLLARYNPDGSLDNSFSGNGLKGTNIPNSNEEGIRSIAIDKANGKIVAGGYYKYAGEDMFVVARYNPDGSLDNSFSGNGLKGGDILVNQEGCFSEGRVNSVAITLNHKVIAGAYCKYFDDNRGLVVRYNPDGSIDKSFGGTGISGTSRSVSEYRSIAVDPNGKVVGGGFLGGFNIFSEYRLALSRHNQNGLIDTNFPPGGNPFYDGPVTDIPNSKRELIDSVAIDSTGKIVVGGYFKGN